MILSLAGIGVLEQDSTTSHLWCGPLLPARAGARVGHGRAPHPHRTLLEAEALRLRKTPTSHAGRGSIGRSTSVGAGVQTRAVEPSVFLVKDGTGIDETPSLARNLAGTGRSSFCAGLHTGTRHTGRSGRYRNGIDKYGTDLLLNPLSQDTCGEGSMDENRPGRMMERRHRPVTGSARWTGCALTCIGYQAVSNRRPLGVPT
jgi:hypothetical protein